MTFSIARQMAMVRRLARSLANHDPRAAHVHALGELAYQLLTGRDPPAGGAPPIPPRALEPAIPLALEQIVLRMLASSPSDRPSLEEVIGLLDALEQDPTGGPPRAPAALPARPVPDAARLAETWPSPIGRAAVMLRWSYRLGKIALILGLVVLGALCWRGRQDEPPIVKRSDTVTARTPLPPPALEPPAEPPPRARQRSPRPAADPTLPAMPEPLPIAPRHIDDQVDLVLGE